MKHVIDESKIKKACEELSAGLKRYVDTRSYNRHEAKFVDRLYAEIIIQSLKSRDERDAFIEYLINKKCLYEGHFSNKLLIGVFNTKNC